jgi:Kdo2-lipid IVA lauroyltransferase/acyltransferase
MPARPRPALRNRVEYLLASFALLTLRRTPLAIANRLGRGYAKLLDAALPRLRAAAMRNLEMALPEMGTDERARTVDGVYRSIGRVLVSFERFPDLNAKNISNWICYDGFEHFEEARRRGRGVLFATGHLGNWELSAFAHALLCAPMHVVVRPLDNPLIDALVERRRALSGNRIIEKKDFARSILKALHRNEAVGILVDQNTGLDQGAFVDFFGIPACSGTSFARIAAHSGAAVLPGFAVWCESERRYRLKFYPLLEISGDAVEDTQRLQAAVERAVREHPEQWLWIHRRWKTRPAGESDRYA